MADTQRRIVVEGVDFAGLFRFPSILRAATMGFQPPRLILGLLLTVAILTAGRAWDGLTEHRVSPRGLAARAITEAEREQFQAALRGAIAAFNVDEATLSPPAPDRHDPAQVQAVIADEFREQHNDLAEQIATAEGPDRDVLRQRQAQLEERFYKTIDDLALLRPRGTFEATATHVVRSFNGVLLGIIHLDPTQTRASASNLLKGTIVSAWRLDPLFTVVYGLVFLVLVALVGGALSRMTATEFARGERLTIQEGMAFALARARRLVFALLLPLLFAGGLTGVLAAGGWLLMMPWIDVLGGALYGVALLVGFGIVFVLAGYALGFPLLLPAVACENCDAADAFQRAYAYAITRPLHLAGYLVVGVIGLTLGYVVAALLAATAINTTGALVDAVTDNPVAIGMTDFSLFNRAPHRAHGAALYSHSAASAWFVTFWQTVVACLVAGYVFANFFGASTIIYLHMRRVCDGQEPGEIWRELRTDSPHDAEAPPAA